MVWSAFLVGCGASMVTSSLILMMMGNPLKDNLFRALFTLAGVVMLGIGYALALAV